MPTDDDDPTYGCTGAAEYYACRWAQKHIADPAYVDDPRWELADTVVGRAIKDRLKEERGF